MARLALGGGAERRILTGPISLVGSIRENVAGLEIGGGKLLIVDFSTGCPNLRAVLAAKLWNFSM